MPNVRLDSKLCLEGSEGLGITEVNREQKLRYPESPALTRRQA